MKLGIKNQVRTTIYNEIKITGKWHKHNTHRDQSLWEMKQTLAILNEIKVIGKWNQHYTQRDHNHEEMEPAFYPAKSQSRRNVKTVWVETHKALPRIHAPKLTRAITLFSDYILNFQSQWGSITLMNQRALNCDGTGCESWLLAMSDKYHIPCS